MITRISLVFALFLLVGCASLPGQPVTPENWFGQGVSYLKAEQYDEAIKAFSKAIETNPRYSEAYYNRGLAWEKKGDLDRAISDFTKVLEINSRYFVQIRAHSMIYRHGAGSTGAKS